MDGLSEIETRTALDQLQVLDTPPEPLFDSLTELAAQTFNAPIALISLIDSERQWFKACIGVDVDQTPLNTSFCQHALVSDDVFVVHDATADPRFCSNPLVTGPPDIRFYAGAPLITAEGHRLGTLCIIDTVVRKFSAANALRLQAIARSVVQALVLRLESRDREQIALLAAQQSELLKQAEQMAGFGTWSWDVAADHTTWSDQVYRIHGYEPGVQPPPLEGVLQHYHPDDAKILKDCVQRAITEGREYEFGARIYRPNGEERHIIARGFCRRDATGEVTGLRGTFQDVTDQVASERFIRTLTDNLPGMVAYWDKDLRCKFANAAHAHWFGRSLDTMLNITFPELFGPEEFPEYERHIQSALSGQRQSFPRTMINAAGEVLYIWSHYIPDVDSTGQTQGFYVLKNDVTPLKRAEEELQDANDLLRRARDQAEAAAAVAVEAARTKADFLANMSHEIRTPLNGVLGFAEVLSNTDLGQDQRRYVDRIRTAGKGLSALIDDILDFSKIEAGKMTIEHRAYDMHGLVSDVLDLTRTSIGDRLVLDLEFAAGVAPWVVGDEQRTRQVLLNLLGNAAKFTHEGKVTLQVRLVGGALEMRVNDTGIGISADAFAVLFTGFTQADTSVGRRFGGSGLGLNISRSLARLMGGDVDLKSEQNVGTTAIFTLPYAPTSAHVPAPRPSQVSSASRGLRILVVDDIETNLELLEILLSGDGHTVVCAASGEVAIETLRTGGEFDLVLMDVQMPGMDGLAATRIIRGLGGRVERIPVVALTANVMSEQIAACRAAGMDDHLGKPVSTDDLFELIDRVARLHADPSKRQSVDIASDERLAALKSRYRSQMETFQQEFARLRGLSGDRSADAIAAFAHSIAGTAGGLGFPGVSTAAFGLEVAAKRCRDQNLHCGSLDTLIGELLESVSCA